MSTGMPTAYVTKENDRPVTKENDQKLCCKKGDLKFKFQIGISK